MKFLVIFVIFTGFCSARWSPDLKVRIESGRILGRYMTSENGKTIRAFMGIPYAEPPVGDLRFRAPVRPAIWNGIRLTQQQPPICLHKDPFIRSKGTNGQEDCLYLNVYAPKFDMEKDKKLAVMVFIHGGGWEAGYGGYSNVPPEYFLDHDIILVTGNYRLGVLGFLSLENQEISGNFGLKDQVMMLAWVRMNIDKFGGDSNRITIFGNSAGGASVNYHSIAPMSKGLFQQGILQSGSLMNFWSDPARPGLAKMRAIRVTSLVGCKISGTNFKEIGKCLREVDGNKLAEVIDEFFEWDTDPVIPFPPVVEDFHQEDEAFISSLHYSKHAFDIPWMVGFTSEEGLIKSASFFNKNNKKLTDDLINNWENILPITFYYDHLPDSDQKEITSKISEYYMNNEPLDYSKRQNFTNMYSDAFFIGILDNLEFRLKDNIRDNTFVYLFSHKGAASFSEVLNGESDKFYGTCHVDELLYLFPLQKTNPILYSSIPTEEDRKLSKLMVELWVNFAKTG